MPAPLTSRSHEKALAHHEGRFAYFSLARSSSIGISCDEDLIRSSIN